MIKERIKILIVEDNPNDVQIIEYHIKKIVESPEIVKVNSFEEFRNKLLVFTPDVILSDYKMNGFNGMEVLKFTKTHTRISNFIFITGTIYNEELAAETILSGATGYILKKNINHLSEKLLPYFNKIINYKKEVYLPEGHEIMFQSMRDFIESANRDNKTHIESYNQIKEALEKIKQKQQG